MVDGDVDDAAIDTYATALVTNDQTSMTPLATDQIKANNGGPAPVLISGVNDPQNVNRLSEGQSLTFAETGMTIVYGDNGSGKSGYARILKSVTRTRAAALVRNDIFREDDLVPAATIIYRRDGQHVQLPWQVGMPSPEELALVSFFDRSCAEIYLSKNTDVAFRPFGLDLFDALVDVCDRVRAQLDERASVIGRRTDGLPTLNASMPPGAFLVGLSAATTDAAIDTECSFDELQQERLATVKQALASLAHGSAASDAERLRRLIERAERVRATIDRLSSVVSPERQALLIEKRDDALAKESAARIARGEKLSGALLPGAGDAPWAALWEAARAYSHIAYEDRAFPVVDDALCVLCQQPIERSAAERLMGFEAFVRDTMQVEARAAQEAWDQECRRLDGVVVAEQQTTDLVADLQAESRDTAATVSTYLIKAEEVLGTLKRLARDQEVTSVTVFPASPSEALVAWIDAVRAREAELRSVATGGGDEHALTAERDDLEARKGLASKRDLVKAERDRLKQVDAISAAKRATTTNAISEKAADITNELLTDVLVDRFSRETDRLGLENVVLRTVGGRRGVLRYKTGFVGAQQEVALPEVLSEGEQTALGMAGLLAEVWTDESRSAVIFDDPVSSLDHERRDKVAERLVQLAKERQTIIFTHDVAFVLALKKYGVREGVSIAERSIERLHAQPGHCSDQHKFSAKLVSERIDEMEGDLQLLQSEQSSMTTEEFRDQTGRWYKQLRKTWERAIEEVVVGEILTRDDLQVHPKMVRTLVLFTAEDNRELQFGYGRATEMSEAHDESAVINSPPPSPDDLAADLAALETWYRRIAGRRNLSEKKIYELAESRATSQGSATDGQGSAS
jgi:energy-coupling factor transporter ATP-binding protein EcfA2